MVVVGGLGSTAGAIFGAIFFTFLSTLTGELGVVWAIAYPRTAGFAQSSLAPIVYGLVIAVFLIFEPRGLNHRWQIFKSTYRLYPFPY
jgi:branched-chain amino acid transport system permease protein